MVLKEISELLELKSENYFRIRAYRQAARQIDHLEEDLTRMVQKNRLKEIPGIGEGIAKEIESLVRIGKSDALEQTRSEVPTGLRRILGVPGIGAKSAQKIYQNLGVSDLAHLKEACETGRIQQIPGFGEKFQQKILKSIEKIESTVSNTLLGVGLPVGQRLTKEIEHFPEVDKVEITGSVRRKKEMVQDIDILVATDFPKKVMEKIIDLPIVYQILQEKSDSLMVLNTVGIKVDFRFVGKEHFITSLLYSTGDDHHIEKLRNLFQVQGVTMAGNGVFDKNNQLIDISSEIEIYEKIGLQYIPPELREDKGELEAAKTHQIPPLVERRNLRGDLHVHSCWSDGRGTIKEMGEAAAKEGHEYLAITDHSQSLKIARGLTEDDVKKQIKEISKVDSELESIQLFSGIEVDILKNGELDLSDEILSQLDFVVASVHQWLDQSAYDMTQRICKAMENPLVHAVAHPTGRILGQRPENELHLDAIFQKAFNTGTALEINATIDRLDLPEKYINAAHRRGVEFLINSDAHGTYALSDLRFGVYVARRAWLPPQKIVNTKSLEEFKEWLKN